MNVLYSPKTLVTVNGETSKGARKLGAQRKMFPAFSFSFSFVCIAYYVLPSLSETN